MLKEKEDVREECNLYLTHLTLFTVFMICEWQMEDLGNLIMKVNEQKMVLENAQTMAETLKALGNATKASKSALKDNQIEDVDKLMDDIAAETDAMREINDRISEPASFMAEYDDDELLADLNDMDAEMLDEQLLAPNALPTVPDESMMPARPNSYAFSLFLWY